MTLSSPTGALRRGMALAVLTGLTIIPASLWALETTRAPGATPPATSQSTAPAYLANAVAVSPGVKEILNMVNAKVDAEVIMEYVKNSPVAYNLSADEIISLKNKGVPQEVLAAMIQHGAEVRAQMAQMAQGAPAAVAPNYVAPESGGPTYSYGSPEEYPDYSYAYATYPYIYPYSYSYWWYGYYPWGWYWPSYCGYWWYPYNHCYAYNWHGHGHYPYPHYGGHPYGGGYAHGGNYVHGFNYPHGGYYGNGSYGYRGSAWAPARGAYNRAYVGQSGAFAPGSGLAVNRGSFTRMAPGFRGGASFGNHAAGNGGWSGGFGGARAGGFSGGFGGRGGFGGGHR